MLSCVFLVVWLVDGFCCCLVIYLVDFYLVLFVLFSLRQQGGEKQLPSCKGQLCWREGRGPDLAALDFARCEKAVIVLQTQGWEKNRAAFCSCFSFLLMILLTESVCESRNLGILPIWWCQWIFSATLKEPSAVGGVRFSFTSTHGQLSLIHRLQRLFFFFF